MVDIDSIKTMMKLTSQDYLIQDNSVYVLDWEILDQFIKDSLRQDKNIINIIIYHLSNEERFLITNVATYNDGQDIMNVPGPFNRYSIILTSLDNPKQKYELNDFF